MEIKEAIEHLDDVLSDEKRWNDCEECKQEHIQLREWLKELQNYRVLEKQGLLVKLPCKIGDVIYKVPSKANHALNIVNGYQDNNRVYCQKVYRITIFKNGTFTLLTCDGLDSVSSDSFGETWFLTEDEAEAKLKELGELNKHLRQNKL